MRDLVQYRIPKGVTHILSDTFRVKIPGGHRGLCLICGTLYIPSSVCIIGTQAFRESYIADIRFEHGHNDPVYIYPNAFYSSSYFPEGVDVKLPRLTTIVLENTEPNLGVNSVFCNLNKLTVNSDFNIEVVGKNSVPEYYISNKINLVHILRKDIPFGLFRSCHLESIEGFDNVQTIGRLSFYNSSGLTKLSFPQVTHIEFWAFAYCTNLLLSNYLKQQRLIKMHLKNLLL